MRDFQHKLTELINEYSKEGESDTPDFILAEFLVGCLKAFSIATNKRHGWYHRRHTGEDSEIPRYVTGVD